MCLPARAVIQCGNGYYASRSVIAHREVPSSPQEVSGLFIGMIKLMAARGAVMITRRIREIVNSEPRGSGLLLNLEMRGEKEAAAAARKARDSFG